MASTPKARKEKAANRPPEVVWKEKTNNAVIRALKAMNGISARRYRPTPSELQTVVNVLGDAVESCESRLKSGTVAEVATDIFKGK
jgi:hypothetical protein